MKLMTRLFHVFLVVVWLSGCALHKPVVVNLPAELPDQYLEGDVTGKTGPAIERWWESFGDEDLNQLMTELFRQNLRLEQGFARLQQARASSRIARSARFPSVDAEAEASRTRQPTFAGDFIGNSTQFSAAARFELDLWGKLAARDRAAAKAAEATYEELQTLYLGLSAQLAELYYLAVEQRSQLALTDETITSFADTVDLVEGRYRLGLVPALDVYQARQSLAAAQAARAVFATNLATAEHAMAVILGRYPQRDALGDLAALPSVVDSFPAGLPSELVGRRPDLRAALRQVEVADQEVGAAIADRFPSVNLLANAGNSRQDFATGLIEGDFWNLLGSLTMPVIDAGRRRAAVERARARVRETVAAYQQALLEAFGEVEDALVTSRLTEQRIARLVETETATDGALRLSLDRYLNGLNDYLPVLTAQRNHFDVQSRLLTARRELISARISLARALGGTWMPNEIKQRFFTEQDESS